MVSASSIDAAAQGAAAYRTAGVVVTGSPSSRPEPPARRPRRLWRRDRRTSRPAAALMPPYWAWVTFAAALNYSVRQLNR
ncbi:hypothetical protein Vqi01_26770 [Micromonospora qiuiae]|uniref:Tryptophan-rich sensory protein n=1 Tax=Micromonospora qiuiae TaxID=502268 RepID=A0ABQ4JC22_9ACTN|nr:hypothetical protein Vqi01_26770 [Micromonospora qiuiae]